MVNKRKNKGGIGQHSLSQYRLKAKSFLAVNAKRKRPDFAKVKSELANLLPLAAASLSPLVAINAQPCPTNPPGSGTSTSSCLPETIKIDLDGGGFDLVIETVLGLRVLGINPGLTFSRYFSGPYAYLNAYDYGDPIDGNSAAFGSLRSSNTSTCGGSLTATQYGWLDYDNSSPGGQWDGGGTFSFGVKLGGRVGFVEISYTDNDNSSSTYTVENFGLVIDASITTADAGTCASLPVELAHFYGQQTAPGSYTLFWETASEFNNAGFEIQRSVDGVEFRKIGWIDGAGTTTETQQYQYADLDIPTGRVYYYRLKQVDYDNQFEYSPIIKFEPDFEGAFAILDVLPNPTNKNFADLRLVSPREEEAEITIYDAVGKQVVTAQMNLAKGQQSIRLDLDQAASGIHFVNVRLRDGQTFFHKLMVAR